MTNSQDAQRGTTQPASNDRAMSDAEMDRISGAISAQRFLLENLYALLIDLSPHAEERARDIAYDMLNKFKTLPVRNRGDLQDFEAAIIREHGLQHLESFMTSLISRFSQSNADQPRHGLCN